MECVYKQTHTNELYVFFGRPFVYFDVLGIVLPSPFLPSFNKALLLVIICGMCVQTNTYKLNLNIQKKKKEFKDNYFSFFFLIKKKKKKKKEKEKEI